MEDEKIVQLYWNRDENAIPVTTEKYGPYCTGIARNILGNYEDAEECVNDTYLNAWNAMPPHRPQILSAFLGKLTRNLSFNRWKHNHADKRGGYTLPQVLDELGECVAGKDSVESELERKELVMALNNYLTTLSSHKRNIFIRRYWYTDSINDIACRFSMTEGGVSMLLSRLRKDLHNYLIKRGFEL